mmetsp:Transcript_64697/g.107496  ORF Transcript_64697/g.107496 Transcript_64697/m.107496 type:complete len:654 (+) Transcript_64697:144-2105(+)
MAIKAQLPQCRQPASSSNAWNWSLVSLMGTAHFKKPQLLTEWGTGVTPENVWREYPRPQLVRGSSSGSNSCSLNGLWKYAVTSAAATVPRRWDGHILVPFAVESQLSGVQRLLEPTEALWYQCRFALRRAAAVGQQRFFLRFEAVDYQTEVWLNGGYLGNHTGGYTPFAFDASHLMHRTGSNTLVVRVRDAMEGMQIRGKQSPVAENIFYTRVSGIWQTVWLEIVPWEAHIEELAITADLSRISLNAGIAVGQSLLQAGGLVLELKAHDANRALAGRTMGSVPPVPAFHLAAVPLTLHIAAPRLWTPNSPHLYALQVQIRRYNDSRRGALIDAVRSYAGMRTVGTKRDVTGQLRLTVNGEELFQLGLLDQGWWPDGLLTPPSDAALLSDVQFAKAAGFNTIRKHVKIESRRFYYHCDRLGILLWQDQPSGFDPMAWPPGDMANLPMIPLWSQLEAAPAEAYWNVTAHMQFMDELEAMIRTLASHPSIVVWVPFNEAWGQHDTIAVGEWLERRDPTRLVNVASGGNFWPVGHIVDAHSYPHPHFSFQSRFDTFVKVMGEFGGHGWAVHGHLWSATAGHWGYGKLSEEGRDELIGRYEKSTRALLELKKRGIAAGIYTQTTDVENEVNGLLTYDRKVAKIDAQTLRRIHEPLLSE